MEILAYSLLQAGPIAFVVSFLFFFFGIELLKENWSYARVMLSIDVVLIIIGIVLDVTFLPRIKF